MLLLLAVVLAAAPEAAPVLGQEEAVEDESPAPSPERLLAMAEKARALVAKHYGEDVEALATPVRVVDRATVIETLQVDLRPNIVLQYGEENADELTAQNAESLGPALLARYSFVGGEVLICRENIEATAEYLESPEMLAEGPLRTLLIHEFVHARDAREVDLAARLGECEDTDGLQALNAVIEGHAQYVTRKIVAEQGWQADFQVFVDSITKVPASITDPSQRSVIELIVSGFDFAYNDGERFVAAVAQARGPESLSKLFFTPPADPGAVLRPTYYLDPASRPKIESAIEPALDHFEAVAVPEAYTRQRVTLIGPQVESILAGVDPVLVEQALEGLLSTRVLVCQNTERMGSMVTATLFEFESPGQGLTFLRTLRALLKLRDELYKRGPIRITDADYTELRRQGGMKGLMAEKVVESAGGEQEVITVLLLRDSTLVELSAIDDEDDTAKLIGWSEEVLQVAHGLMEPATAAAADEAPASQPEEDGAERR
ncbi:MAG: hypothetical protein AAFZ65_11200 [Planctomycetota bacterium]